MMTKAMKTKHEGATDDAVAQEALRQRRDDLRQRLADAEARSATRWDVAELETREKREAREEALELRPMLAQAERDLATAEAAARARIVAARRPGRVERLRRLLDAVEVAAHEAAALREWDVATARLCGLGDEQGEMHPTPELLDTRDVIARLHRLIEPPAPLVREPVRPGKVRVNITQPFFDREWMGAKRYPGICDLDADTAKEVIKKGWAVAV